MQEGSGYEVSGDVRGASRRLRGGTRPVGRHFDPGVQRQGAGTGAHVAARFCVQQSQTGRVGRAGFAGGSVEVALARDLPGDDAAGRTDGQLHADGTRGFQYGFGFFSPGCAGGALSQS